MFYPSLGTYVMTVDWIHKTFTLVQSTPPPVQVQPALDVRASATDAANSGRKNNLDNFILLSLFTCTNLR